jgi:pantoate--beta-alanine ligase
VKQVHGRDDLWPLLKVWKREGCRIALVPTMGNLHEGHLALVRAARAIADRVVTSIYVNPTQFGKGEDFESYPRTLEADLEKLRAEQCDLVFVPDDRTMYPFRGDESVTVNAAPALANKLEGRFRPGHFDGVLTVVARLFNLLAPNFAVFGEKDYQQLLLIRRLVDDMAYPVEIVAHPTVREAGGLAMSSRNRYLDEEEMAAAVQLNRVLREAAEFFAQQAAREQVEEAAVAQLEKLGFDVDYVAVRRARDLEIPGPGERNLRLLAAARCGATRLIDNISIN